MSRPRKDITKLSEQGVVTEEALLAYVNNELSVPEKQELEKLLKDDPFAQDALEGLQASQNKAAVAGSISSLNKMVRERSGLKEQRKSLSIHWTNYAWAAVILGLLIGIGFVMIGYLEKPAAGNLAMDNKPKNTEQPVIIQEKQKEAAKSEQTIVQADSSPVLNGNVTYQWQQKTDEPAKAVTSAKPGGPAAAVPDDKSKLQVQSSPTGSIQLGKTNNISTTTGAAITVQGTSSGLVNSNARLQTMNSTITADDKDIGTPKEKPVYTPSPAKEEPLANGSANWKGNPKVAYYGSVADSLLTSKDIVVISGSKREKKEAERAVQLEDGMKSFNSGDYKTASETFEKILNHEPDNADALYFGGISDYINGKTAKSEKYFDKLLKKGSKYVDGAKWYKANILIKKGAIEEGKKLLQDLTATNGSYKERAVKKIAELGF